MCLLDPYLDDVAPPIDVRRQRFADWVKRAVARAKEAQGLSVPEIAKRAEIGNQTIYRWIKAEGKELPEPDRVVAFCDAIDVPPDEPFRILWPGKNDPATAPEPIPLSGDLALLMRRLHDPSVSEFEKEFIRETVRQLAARPARPGHEPKRTRRRGVAS
jgi:transcriptional regulator with XRE-family HTH domain